MATLRDKGTLSSLDNRLDRLVKANKSALNKAAFAATKASIAQFNATKSNRPKVASRNKRQTTGGRFPTLLNWKRQSWKNEEYARFQRKPLDTQAGYWLIQEIGTGNTARILDTNEVVKIPSQRGRKIKKAFQFADVGGGYQAPGAGRYGSDQIRNIRDIKDAPFRPDLTGIRIEREIEPKGFVQTGGRIGMQKYRQEIGSDFRTIFKKRK